MFDANNFKRSVKEWVREHPQGSTADLSDYCEELIPPAFFSTHQWLIEQTIGWYQNLLSQRRQTLSHADDGDVD